MDRSEIIARLSASTDRLHAAGIHALYLFGSVARNEARADSDVDLFVDPDYERFGFVEWLRTEALLSAELGRPVDLATREALHPLLRAGIERDAIRVLWFRRPFRHDRDGVWSRGNPFHPRRLPAPAPRHTAEWRAEVARARVGGRGSETRAIAPPTACRTASRASKPVHP